MINSKINIINQAMERLDDEVLSSFDCRQLGDCGPCDRCSSVVRYNTIKEIVSTAVYESLNKAQQLQLPIEWSI